MKEQSTQSRNKIKRAKKGNQETESRNEALSQETERSGKKQYSVSREARGKSKETYSIQSRNS